MLRTLLDRRLFSIADTQACAVALAGVARRGDVFALWGGLGVGKTVLARAFIRARGYPQDEIPSPTFTLVQIYEPPAPSCPIFHFDLYRLQEAEDVYELGIEDAFADGIVLIEWPDRLGSLLPSDRLDVCLQPGATDDARQLVLAGSESWQDRLREKRLG
ncbi:MAG: tRNA (adenosine(37)-N6)-threonylcarbamoyltransferase complex ATPase subunit type 1 TsaE [Rhodospirillales bacterium]|nr:tRNA (adenosine(37)-N6)-threonylcarbamoyltransferase complex ATPase subunit type 1 TsaE [Rhodospirillales bacterium]